MSTATDAVLENALAEVAASGGLVVDRAIDGDALAGVAGPFLAVDVSTSKNERCFIAVRDDVGGDAEQLLAALAAAVAPDLEPVPVDPVPSGAEIRAHFDGPVTVTALSNGNQVTALVIAAVDRRAATAATAPAPALPESIAKAAGGFDKLAGVSLDVSVELGRTRVTLSDVLAYDVGSVVELDRPAGAPVDVRVNGTLLAQGEVVLIDDEYAVRITAIVDTHGDT